MSCPPWSRRIRWRLRSAVRASHRKSQAVWKDEAFEIWSRVWGSFYPEGDSSRNLLEEVYKSYFSLSLIDNDYIHGDLFTVFAKF
ncbi:hypothetical protein ABKV19_008957 [Rosa sericea]